DGHVQGHLAAEHGGAPARVPMLLEGLSPFLNERLCAVLSVDEQSASCDSLGLLDALGFGERCVFYAVGIVARLSRVERRCGERALHLAGGDFRDLRQLRWEWAR